MERNSKIRDLEGNGTGAQPGRWLTMPFAALGRTVIGWVNQMGASFIFLCLAFLQIFKAKQLPKIVQQIYYIGAKSSMIVLLVGFFTGMVLGLNPTMPS